MPFPGSELYVDMVKSGKLDRKDWHNYSSLTRRHRHCVRGSEPAPCCAASRSNRFYMRPQVIARQLFGVRTIDARQMAAGVWSVVPDVPRLWSAAPA